MAPKALERALPGLIIGLGRHVLGLSNPNQLDEEKISEIKLLLEPYLKDAEVYSAKLGSDDVSFDINDLLQFWYRKVKSDDGDSLTWGDMGSSSQDTDLTIPFGESLSHGAFAKIPLLMSMRNVDGESRGAIAPSTDKFGSRDRNAD